MSGRRPRVKFGRLISGLPRERLSVNVDKVAGALALSYRLLMTRITMA